MPGGEHLRIKKSKGQELGEQIFLTGCIRIPRIGNSNVVVTSYGAYQIENLVKREDHSTSSKVFYVFFIFIFSRFNFF